MSDQAFPEHFQWLFDNGPSIPISNASKNIQILQTPQQFHTTLMTLAKQARRRITLATLYMGTDSKTQELISQCDSTLSENPDLKLTILCDYARGNRNSDSTRKSTKHLKEKYPSQFRLSMYHTPELRGWKKRFLSQRINEVVGVQHAKIYLFDDTVVMTGANLSEIYFTNRQDRYVVYRDQRLLCNYLGEVVRALQGLSIDIDENDEEICNSVDPVNCKVHEFVEHAQSVFEPLIMPKQWGGKWTNEGPGEYTTWVFPTFQAYQLGIQHDSETTLRLLHQTFTTNSDLKISTGYFNLAQNVSDCILSSKPAKIDILMASEQANGFYKAKGLAGIVPSLYKYVSSRFGNVIQRCQLNDKVTLTEWRRAGWTFHGKGLWYWDRTGSEPEEQFMCNIVGSSNFGYRSCYRDTELQLIMVTIPGSEDTKVLSKLYREEQQYLWNPEYSTALTETTCKSMLDEVPKWLQYFSIFLRNYI